MKPSKAAGPDGATSDVVCNLPALTTSMHLLFSVMLRFGVYPFTLGFALVQVILKPGKPIHEASRLRGIRSERFRQSVQSWI